MYKRHKYIFIRGTLVLSLIGVFVAISAYISSCKKIDLKRYAAIKTVQVSDITAFSAIAFGDIIDLGEKVSDHGFCYSFTDNPTINDMVISGGNPTKTGEYYFTVDGLNPDTRYFIRSFIVDANGIIYGNSTSFTTLKSSFDEWLYYDDGNNNNGIGYDDGREFDIAIIFPKESIQAFSGSVISKVRFFPRVDSPAEYYITIWEGESPPELIVVEHVTNPVIGNWTEYTLNEPHLINTGKDLWVGCWIFDYPPGTYPAGVDFGPAETGLGDLISTDAGYTWSAMSTLDPPNLNYNWNLQVYVQTTKGSEVIIDKKLIKRERKRLDNAIEDVIPVLDITQENR